MEQSENGGESEEESEVDPHLLLRRINEQLSQQQRDDGGGTGNGGTELKFDDLRRLYELNNNNNNSSSNNNNNNNNNSNNDSNTNNSNNNSNKTSNNEHTSHIPEAHRPSSCSSSSSNNNNNNNNSSSNNQNNSNNNNNSSNSVTNSTFSAFTQHFPGDRESRDRLMQYHLSTYLSNQSYQHQFTSATLPNLSTMMQPGTSFQSLPGSRIPSPHGQPFQRKPSSPPPFSHSSPSFPSPPPAHTTKRSASVSSRQSRDEESTSPVHQTSWSFEEQFKQLYDIDRDDVKRKEFLDDLFSFMQKHETPVTRLPIMAKSVLDLYELYKLVVQRGGLVDVINKKLWQEVIKGLNLPSSITSAAFTLRTQYMKFLYAYECHKLGLSTRSELETAIEGNKREGRRTSYYGDLGQMRSPNGNSANNGHPSSNSMHHHGGSRISPVSLVTTSTANSSSNRLQINGHSNQFANHVGDAQLPNVSGLVLPNAPVPLPTDPRIIEYFKHMNSRLSNHSIGNGTGSSPDVPETSNLNNLEMANLALWNIYNGVVKPPLPQAPILSFQQLSRPLSQDSNNEAPLDLGKNRKTDSGIGDELQLRAPKRERDEESEEESESESEDEAELMLPSNSSQGSQNVEITTPLAIQIKINGVKYRGVLHPKRRKI